MPIAEILSQGDEVVTGQTVDTNAAWLAEQLTGLGFDVRFHTTVGDRLGDIRDAFVRASERADLCLCSGGLGPTDDDLTAEAVSGAFGRPLVLDEEALAWITALFERFGRRMAPSNRKQALLPEGALRLDNHWGTAPGFAVEAGRCFVACMPGVPREMKPMFAERVLPALQRRFAVRPGRLVTLRTTGIAESTLQERIGHFEHPEVALGYRCILPENHVKLRFPADWADEAVRAMADDVRGRIGSSVFAVDGLGEPGGALIEVVARLLAERGETLAVAESCTGGGLGAECTSVPGASGWFVEGVVAYANAAKIRRLGVDAATLDAHGAVSEPVAREMAEGVRAGAGTTYGLSTTGIAGPGGGTPDKPVGTVHVALATPDGTTHRLLRLGGERSRIQSLTIASALDLLRRHFLDPSPSRS